MRAQKLPRDRVDSWSVGSRCSATPVRLQRYDNTPWQEIFATKAGMEGMAAVFVEEQIGLSVEHNLGFDSVRIRENIERFPRIPCILALAP